MVGAIGHATLIAAGQPGLDALIEEWTRDVRHKFGDVVSYVGHVHGEPNNIVIILLLSDEAAFNAFMEQVGSDPWWARFMQHVDGDVDWETIEVNQV